MLKRLIKISDKQLILPFYHLVSDKVPDYVNGLYKPKTIKQFKTDLEVLLKYYKPINLEQVIKYNKGELELAKPSFHLTFDDGLANFYYEIAPILIKKNIPATVFLNTDFIDNKGLFYRYKASLILNNSKHKTQNTKFKPLEISFKKKYLLDDYATKIGLNFNEFLEKEKPYLSLEQIKELQKQGFTFGAHSKNHPKYQDLTLKEQLQQTRESVQWISNNLNEQYNTFSFPFYDIGISKQFFNKIQNYTELTFGTSGLKIDEITTNLHRLDMEKSKKTYFFLIKKHLVFLIKKNGK